MPHHQLLLQLRTTCLVPAAAVDASLRKKLLQEAADWRASEIRSSLKVEAAMRTREVGGVARGPGVVE